MLPILTGILVGGLQVAAVPEHLRVLAPRAAIWPARGGTTGGYWGMAHGALAMLVGLVALLARDLAEIPTPVEGGAFAIGVLLMLVGLVAAYRASTLEAHDHPHLHGSSEHEHIHLHRAPAQLHDHDRPRVEILKRAVGPWNLVAVLPALVLVDLDAVLYLSAYLAVSMLAMGGFGYWLGHSRKRGDEPGWVLRLARTLSYAVVGIGFLWMVVWWPS